MPGQQKENNIITMSCVAPDCIFHVYFNWDQKPLPALVGLKEGQKAADSKERYPYLTCDNPITPHTNRYVITKAD